MYSLKTFLIILLEFIEFSMRSSTLSKIRYSFDFRKISISRYHLYVLDEAVYIVCNLSAYDEGRCCNVYIEHDLALSKVYAESDRLALVWTLVIISSIYLSVCVVKIISFAKSNNYSILLFFLWLLLMTFAFVGTMQAIVSRRHLGLLFSLA